MSKVIRFFSKMRFWTDASCCYSHSSWSFCRLSNGMLVGDTSEWESWQPNGVRHNRFIGDGHTPGTRVDLFELVSPIPTKKISGGIIFLQGQIGKKYDWGGILGVFLRRNEHSEGRWFCSEFVDAFLKVCDVHLFNFVESYQVVPGLIPSSPIVRYVGYIITGEKLEEGFIVHDPQGESK